MAKQSWKIKWETHSSDFKIRLHSYNNQRQYDTSIMTDLTDRSVEWNCPEINPYIYGQLILNQGTKHFSGKECSFQ